MRYIPNELNYTKVKTYRNCPYLFKRLYLDGKRAPLTPPSSLGISLHRALEAYHLEGRDAGDLLAYYDLNWFGAGYADAKEQMEYYLKGKALLERFWKSDRERKSEVSGAEKTFDFDYKSWIIRGTVDRLDRHPDGSWEIIDYKTGPEIKTEAELSGSLQLGIYGVGARRCWNLTPSLLTIWFLAYDKTVSVPYDPGAEERILSEFDEAGSAILRGEFAPDHGHCRFCSMNQVCPERAAEEQKP